jgi:hypothetical protein
MEAEAKYKVGDRVVVMGKSAVISDRRFRGAIATKGIAVRVNGEAEVKDLVLPGIWVYKVNGGYSWYSEEMVAPEGAIAGG